MQNIYFLALVTSIIGETGVAGDVISGGTSLGNLPAACILGIVSLAAVIGLVKVYREKQEENKETIQMLKDTIDKNTVTLQALKDNCVARNKG